MFWLQRFLLTNNGHSEASGLSACHLNQGKFLFLGEKEPKYTVSCSSGYSGRNNAAHLRKMCRYLDSKQNRGLGRVFPTLKYLLKEVASFFASHGSLQNSLAVPGINYMLKLKNIKA